MSNFYEKETRSASSVLTQRELCEAVLLQYPDMNTIGKLASGAGSTVDDFESLRKTYKPYVCHVYTIVWMVTASPGRSALEGDNLNPTIRPGSGAPRRPREGGRAAAWAEPFRRANHPHPQWGASDRRHRALH